MDLRGKRSSYRNVVVAIYLSLRLKGPHISEMRNKGGKLTACLIYALFFFGLWTSKVGAGRNLGNGGPFSGFIVLLNSAPAFDLFQAI